MTTVPMTMTHTETQFDILDALAREIERVQTGQAVTTTGKAVTPRRCGTTCAATTLRPPFPWSDLLETWPGCCANGTCR
jgi:hypothetical protein